MARKNLWSVAAVVAGATVGNWSPASAQTFSGTPRQGERHLATRPVYPERMVDDVRRPGSNGRHWISRGFIGDPQSRYEKRWPLAWGNPGPAAYGADEEDFSVAYVRVAHTAVSISPWESIDMAGYQNLERGRQEWLKERGYTGGVRTFTNPLYRRRPVDRSITAIPAEQLPQPRMVIELPPDMPRFKKRQEVQAVPASEGSRDVPRAIVVVRTKDDRPVSPVVPSDEKARVVVREARAGTGPLPRVSSADLAPPVHGKDAVTSASGSGT
ncbi:MAG: hypothetical protein KF787_13070 [Phycisphaeraceae bacterium]|nr:hypothetical protein [Phycisphaerae bacterium]MBX3393565.1 hypothetical protein [Phycisphaeraceae bacterium]HRJ50475.1 hypothetical protein [Phycisphaerales bacterium]